MVERLKEALERARERRTQDAAPPERRPAPVQPAGAEAWAALQELQPDPRHMSVERVVTFDRKSPAYAAFDLLRTRLLKLCKANGIRRIGVTSPTKHCGKSVVCANLAISSARHPETRTLLVDADLRAPRLHEIFGVATPGALRPTLLGESAPSTHLRRIGGNLALALNNVRERDAAELLQSPLTAKTLEDVVAALRPDLVLYDLPPVLAVDDALGFLSNLDGVLLVAAAGQTTAHEINEAEHLLSDGTRFLGSVLNKHDGDPTEAYTYEYL